jgi:hypothetical protein
LFQYCQDHVFVFTTAAAGAQQQGVWIPGFLAVFNTDIPRLAWTSYDKVRQHANARDKVERKKPLQITDVPELPVSLEQFTLKLALAQVHSLWKHTPDLGGVPVVKVTLEDEQTTELPPFLFYHGGVRELFHAVRTLVPMSRSKDDPDLFLVNDQTNMLYRSVSCMEDFPNVAAPATPGQPVQLPPVLKAERKPGNNGGVVSSAISVLTTVGRLARFAAGAFPASSASPSPPPSQPGPAASVAVPPPPPQNKPTPLNSNEPAAAIERSAEFKTSLGDFQVVEDYASVKSAQEVAELARMIAKPERSRGLDEETWIASFDGEGRIAPEQQNKLRDLAFSGGVDPTVRREMWKYLLKYYPWDSTFEQREQLRRARANEYQVYKNQWQSITPMQLANFHKFRDRKHMIEKDVMRTDRTEPYFAVRPGAESDDSNHFDATQNPHLQVLHDVLLTYSMFNFDMSYVQGMNDLLSPILTEMDDEADAFWCFKGLMDSVGANFRKDQSGMSAQLRRLQSLVRHLDEQLFEYLKTVGCENFFFTFRWLLLHFKRELDYDGVKMVWEAIWASPDPEHFHLFIVFAILQQVRDHIIMEKLEFDSLVQLCNGMSGKLQYPEILSAATHWFLLFPKLFPDAAERERILL